jgi:hypothetical protein
MNCKPLNKQIKSKRRKTCMYNNWAKIYVLVNKDLEDFSSSKRATSVTTSFSLTCDYYLLLLRFTFMQTFKLIHTEPVPSGTEIKRLTGRFQLFNTDIKQFLFKHVIYLILWFIFRCYQYLSLHNIEW